MKDSKDHQALTYCFPFCGEIIPDELLLKYCDIVADLDRGKHFVDPLLLFNQAFHASNYEEGIVAIGGKITPDLLEEGYRYGIFCWSDYRYEARDWFCPKMRYVIFPEKIHISHSMRNYFNKGKYHVTFNKNFEDVIQNCSLVDDRINEEGAWLAEEMIETFKELHRRGLVRSVEVWKDENLVGGLYGIWKNGIFQGESMFSKAPSASKYALIALADRMKREGGEFIDVQIPTDFFQEMGAEFISYTEFRRLMAKEGQYSSLND